MRRGWHNRGYLSHLDYEDAIQHVVFRLADSLPKDVVQALDILDRAEQRKRVDVLLDAGHGSMLLRKPEAANIVTDALRHFDDDRYHLHAWCVMPNHVHVIFQPLGERELGAIVRSWKAFSAATINKLLDRQGPLWAPDYFDRYVRDDDHLAASITYVEANPVRAGLCLEPAEWPYSSAHRKECGPEGPRSEEA